MLPVALLPTTTTMPLVDAPLGPIQTSVANLANLKLLEKVMEVLEALTTPSELQQDPRHPISMELPPELMLLRDLKRQLVISTLDHTLRVPVLMRTVLTMQQALEPLDKGALQLVRDTPLVNLPAASVPPTQLLVVTVPPTTLVALTVPPPPTQLLVMGMGSK
jgi:hypothetical protein